MRRELDLGPIEARLAARLRTGRTLMEFNHTAPDDVAALVAEVKQLRAERLLLAKLAADTPQSYNPFEVGAWRELRDAVLADADQER